MYQIWHISFGYINDFIFFFLDFVIRSPKKAVTLHPQTERNLSGVFPIGLNAEMQTTKIPIKLSLYLKFSLHGFTVQAFFTPNMHFFNHKG
jgi:hypothetical protein